MRKLDLGMDLMLQKPGKVLGFKNSTLYVKTLPKTLLNIRIRDKANKIFATLLKQE